jgi:hypothetical protein
LLEARKVGLAEAARISLERIAAERDQPPRESARQNKELEHFQHRIAFPLRLKML